MDTEVRGRLELDFTPWTPEREGLLRSMWGGPLTCEEIAGQLGQTTIRAVMSKGHRMGLPRREVKFNKKRGDWKWTLEQNEVIRSLWGKISCQAIADTLGHSITKASVIGKARRLGLEKQKHVKAVKKGQHKSKRRLWKPTEGAPQQAADSLRDLPADQSPDAISLFNIGPDQCRWPLNNTTPISKFLFCGSPKDFGQSYCGRHCQVAFRGKLATPSEREAARRKRLRYRTIQHLHSHQRNGMMSKIEDAA